MVRKKGADRIRTFAFLSEYQEGDAIALFFKDVQPKNRN